MVGVRLKEEEDELRWQGLSKRIRRKTWLMEIPYRGWNLVACLSDYVLVIYTK